MTDKRLNNAKDDFDSMTAQERLVLERVVLYKQK